MRLKLPVVSAACAFVMLLAASPVQAQTRSGGDGTVSITRDEQGRVRTRIILQRRSYLDAGTEVLPGQRKYTDYVNPPGQRPIDALGPGKGYDRQPLNGPFDYGFRNW